VTWKIARHLKMSHNRHHVHGGIAYCSAICCCTSLSLYSLLLNCEISYNTACWTYVRIQWQRTIAFVSSVTALAAACVVSALVPFGPWYRKHNNKTCSVVNACELGFNFLFNNRKKVLNLHTKRTRNAWQSLAYSPLCAVVSPPREYL